MKFFSGFCFQNEKEIFRDWTVEGDFVVAGFSKGAIEAFEYAYSGDERVDRLILLSPAFFQTEKETFRKLQLKAFERDKNRYRENFYDLCVGSSGIEISDYKSDGSIEELRMLLYYRWSKKKIEELQSRGVVTEVFIGSEDKIVDSAESLEFFKNISSTWYIKGVGHLLR